MDDSVKTLKLSAWQGRCADGDLEANLEAALGAVEEAGAKGADFLCLPECFLSGYGSRALVEAAALRLDDPRLLGLARAAALKGIVLLAGLAERLSTGELGNTMAVFDDGRLLGLYRKTMLIESDAGEMGFCRDYDLPVFQAKGITFGCIVCHDSSFVEPASVLAYRGAQVIFSPHYNYIPAASMDSHRITVRNNHVGLAALLGIYVVRANTVGRARLSEQALGYGDSAIFAPNGSPIAEAGLFTERLIVAEMDARSRRRLAWKHDELPERVRRQLADELVNYRRSDPALAPAGEDRGGMV
ncbi:MAG: carbon-nitrogen hydrolase family protein [Armatimonadetes bacterium]|nr:carbon-nitrogen hydrolase family protein [Armatimonadota bacterium]